DQCDFLQFAGRQAIFDKWCLRLPFFETGFAGLNEKLERLQRLENDFLGEVEKEKIASMRQLAYGASHEVNNPLANISTRAQALLRDETDPKRRQRLKTIDAQAFRAHDMISNLMTFARPARPVFDQVQLSATVARAVESLQSVAKEQRIEIELDVENSIYFEADPGQLQEMLFALVQNSIESIRQDGKIKVKSHFKGTGELVEVEVMDDGPGISAEVRRHIFDPFFSGREAGRGLGFGLSKVWRLMELHHGRVEVRERDGMTCVLLVFPGAQPGTGGREIEKTA
ncbi:MAG: HAMP domain-containing sensor histidine kinase, partial [Planctomycetota bacterium]|nr:HAMP domain-containing sensor histidine kinase [Planctomycetota bacterium]